MGNVFQKIIFAPPQEKYWDTLIQDTYNLKPKDFKEQEGAFFTPDKGCDANFRKQNST